MSLREAIGAVRDRMQGMNRVQLVPEHPALKRRSEELARRFAEAGRPPSTTDLNEILNRFRRALLRDEWQNLTAKDWRGVTWGLWVGDAPLADAPRFLDRYVDHLRARQRRNLCKNLILAYLQDFAPSSGSIRRVAAELADMVQQWDWVWADRHRTARLFDPDEAPRSVARICLASDHDPFSVLESLGLAGSRSVGGLAQVSYRYALDEVRATAENRALDGATVEKILSWSVKDGTLAYPRHKTALAEALLLPWQERAPDEDVRERIIDFVLTQFRDPRVSRKEWIGVSEAAERVMKRWLTRIALDQFFEIVDDVADQGMWKFRRAFWTAYFDAGFIDEAWVVFGPIARRRARALFNQAGAFGQLRGGLRDHSVLIMRIDKLTIADWSHSGKCHIWRDGNASAPRLYAREYNRDDVIHGSDNGGTVHASSGNGLWQQRVADFIWAHTGIRLSETAYMPRGWRRYG